MDIDPNILRILVPALAGAAGTGAVGAYLSHNHHPLNENPRERRRRIMRAALMGGALGGTAGAALPAGARMLSQAYNGEGMGDPFNKVLGFGGRHLGGIAGGGAAGFFANRYANESQQKAQKSILDMVKGMGESPGIRNRADLSSTLSSTEGKSRILSHLAANKNSNPFYANELLREAGHSGASLNELGEAFGGGMAGPMDRETILSQFGKHLSDQGPVSRMVGRLATDTHVHGVRPSAFAEAYSNVVRPSVRRVSGRMGPLTLAALTGGAALTGQHLQNRLAGN